MNAQAVEDPAGGDQVAAAPLAPRIKVIRKFKLEDALHFFVYIAYLVFGVFVLLSVRPHVHKHGRAYGFNSGWKMLQQPQDESSEELRLYGQSMARMVPQLLVHAVLSGIGRLLLPGKHMLATTLWGMLMMGQFKRIGMCIVCGMFATFFVMSKFNTKLGTWTVAIAWMWAVHKTNDTDMKLLDLDYLQLYQLIILMSWAILRGISFNCNRITASADERKRLYTLPKFLGYCFYYPTMIFGPHIEYTRYLTAWENPTNFQGGGSLPKQLLTLALNALRAYFWWNFMQFALHYLYIHYMVIEGVGVLELVRPSFGLHAVGYFMGQFFYMFYVVCYGVGIAFATYDGMRPPNRPRCIGRIHYYSDMWKYFDEGLYEFLFKHIYCVLCARDSSLLRKLFATAITFLFIFVWHGCFEYVLIWSVLNFACLVVEKFMRAFMASRWYDRHINRLFTEKGQQRVRALLSTQIFIPAAFSNVYFIGGVDVGNFLMGNAYLNGVASYAALTFCSYCFFQCSEYILDKQNE